MVDDDDGEQIIQWVHNFHGDMLVWHADSMDLDHPYSQGWVDVLCEELQNDMPMNWVWTIEPDSEDIVDAPWSFRLEPDLTLWIVWDPGFADSLGPQRFEIPIDKNRFPNATELGLLDKALHEASEQAFVIGCGAWSPERISMGLSLWADINAGRPDIRFHWNPDGPPSPLLEDATRSLESLRSGEDEGVILKPGETEGGTGFTIRASSNVMDFLMRDPDTAAEIMEALNEHLSDYENNGDDDNDSDDV